MILHLLQPGRIDYPAGLALQAELIAARKAGRIGDTLVLLEHPPVLTIGRNAASGGARTGGRANILASDELLARRGIALHETTRGGDVTYHGPGQLVGYPIFDLRGFTPRLGAVDFVRRMEEGLIRLCGEYGVRAQRICGRTGVWTMASGTVQERKIAAIGIHISGGITSHGFAFNLTTDLRDFALIVPCGIADRAVTSLELEIDTARHPLPSFVECANAAARQFGRLFERQVMAHDSLEDLLAACAVVGAAESPVAAPVS